MFTKRHLTDLLLALALFGGLLCFLLLGMFSAHGLCVYTWGEAETRRQMETDIITRLTSPAFYVLLPVMVISMAAMSLGYIFGVMLPVLIFLRSRAMPSGTEKRWLEAYARKILTHCESVVDWMPAGRRKRGPE